MKIQVVNTQQPVSPLAQPVGWAATRRAARPSAKRFSFMYVLVPPEHHAGLCSTVTSEHICKTVNDGNELEGTLMLILKIFRGRGGVC